ncbi:MAG: guanylate kinase [Candidatus Omnitrophica bacterium]|nr:guanylate kinase [Candidatus Omnitrophota bacterium]
MKKKGRLFVLSAPSGSGKTTVLRRIVDTDSHVTLSVSATTRPPRPGEKNGRDYFFYSRKRFESQRKRGGFIEYAKILDNWYGTPRRPVEQALRLGRDVLLGLDIQGARQIRKSGLPATTIFLLPPSLAVLEHRLKKRGTETPGQIRARLQLARKELREVKHYDYAVMNDRLQEAIETVKAILRAEKCRVKKVGGEKR